MSCRLLCDSRGKSSWTVTLAVPAVIAITTWFLFGGLDLTVELAARKIHILTATKSAAEYAAAVGVWLGFFAQREWTEKKVAAAPASAPEARAP